VDPFLDLIGLLRPRATLWAGIHGVGRWGVSFHKRDDVLFCWVERGTCQLIRPHAEPLHLQPEDFVLIRSTAPFTLTSDPSVEPADSEEVVAATKDPILRLGEDSGTSAVLKGGRFVFETANEDLLTSLLPSLVHVAGGDTFSWRVRSLLTLNEAESANPGPGSGFIVARASWK
jgi:hypothetical protein